MKAKLTTILGLLIIFTFCVNAQESSGIVGTWKLQSSKYGNGPLVIPADSIMRIKLITPTHFIWIHYIGSQKEIMQSAGGRYTLEGDVYTESIDFGLNMKNFIGTKSIFNIKTEGDKMFISGTLSGGLEIEETWEKVK